MSAMIANFIQLSLPDYLKSAKPALSLAPYHLFIPDKSRHAFVANRNPKGFQLRLLTLDNQFHPSIQKIPYGAHHVKTRRQLLYRVSKSDTLNAPRIINQHPTPT